MDELVDTEGAVEAEVTGEDVSAEVALDRMPELLSDVLELVTNEAADALASAESITEA